MISSISSLQPIKKEMQLHVFTLSSDKTRLDNLFLDKGFKNSLGSVEMEKFKSGCYFFCETEFKTLSETELKDEETSILKDNITLYHGILDSYISFLWFTRDNCCSLNSLYVYLPSAKRMIARKAMPIFSTSKGIENLSVKFDEKDLRAVGAMFIGSTNLFYHKNVRQAIPDDKLQDSIVQRQIIPYDFKKQTRIERAFQFLLLSRRTSQLALKISFYICVYETLFYGNTSGEISHQIAERVALYSSGTRMFRNSIYKQIKEAYNIRSTYFHGNSFKGFKKDLSEISFQLDNLTRQVLYKIFAKDSEIFLQTDDLLEMSYLDMIFEDERKPEGLTVEIGLKHKRFRN